MNFDELRRDIEEHIEHETRDNIDRGMTPEAARAGALRKFGNTTRIAEDTWSVWHAVWVDRLLQDARYAFRVLSRNPGFAAVAILTLALGIGMNTAVFTVVNAVLLNPLPYPDADRLVWLAEYSQWPHFEAVRAADYFDWKARSHSFEKMVPYGDFSASMDFGSQADQVGGIAASDEFLAITGARPERGRLFTTADRNVILITHRLWGRRFGRDPDIVGKPVVLGGQPFTICGVLPESYRFALPLEGLGPDIGEIEAYIPEFLDPQDRRADRILVSVVAKLRPGVHLSQAAAELEAIQRDIARRYPAAMSDSLKLRVLPMQERLVGESRRALLVLLAAVAFVLLIACANIANVTLARATSRQREIAIRAAIGAGRVRMIAQMLAEGIVLALIGGAAGLLFARLTLGAVVRFGSHAVPRLGEAAIDLRVLGFTLVVSMATGILFGLGPAISVSRASLACVLKDGGSTVSPGASRIAIRRFLMAGELAVTLVLLASAGLMIRSFWRMSAHPPGFAPESILTMKVALSGPSYRAREAQIAYFDRLLDRVSAAPGVSAAAITNVPVRGIVRVEGIQFPEQETPHATYHSVSAGYFQAMGMRLVAGRWLTGREPSPAVMINESFARAVFGKADPLGRRMTTPASSPTQESLATIVGVVADLRYAKLDAKPAPETYIPYRQAIYVGSMDIMVRTAGDASAMAEAIRKLIRDLDRTQPVYDVQTLEQALAGSIAPRRFNLLLLGIFAAVALVLAVVGIYGVMGYAVAQRTHEIGVRMALGARRGEVVRMVVQQGMAIAAAGIAVGAVAALGLTRVMGSLLYEIAPTDGPTFAVVCGVLAAAAFLACCLPALRASKVDPVVALRYE
ncbi:MAG TPA: ABC transporter permease [Bryobacteraceae bacterium]|nr:ABC transporter permease [Bryobacteraceae bacterium]